MAFYTHVAERPDHVPAEAVYDFDYHRDPGLFVEPHKRVMELVNDAPPLFWTPHNGGHWMAIGYDLVFHVMREPDTFSSSLFPPSMVDQIGDRRLPDGRRVPRMTPIMLDPPEHTRMRGPLQRTFSPKTVIGLKDEIDALAARLIEAAAPLGHCDFLSAVIEQLPVRIFLKMMGLPDDRIDRYRALVRQVFEPRDPTDPMGPLLHGRRIADEMLPIIEARRADPRDDIISMLWATEIDGEAMTLDLMEDYCLLLFLAGLDTVINAMAHGTRHLALNPDLQARLRAEPGLIVEATEEMLRRYTVSAPIRRVIHDTNLAGRRLKQDDLVVTYLSAADLDPSQFPDPLAFDIARENKNHLLFGAGPHRCLGSHLARIELQSYYRHLLEILPEFRLDPEQAPIFHAGNMLAISSLPLRWD